MPPHYFRLLIKSQLPRLTARPRFDLEQWVEGTLAAENSCQDSAAQILESCGPFETVRCKLREWLYDDGERITSWGPGKEVEVEALSPAL